MAGSSPTDTAAAVSSSAAGGLDFTKNKNFAPIGLALAVGSGLFIGASFVVKKKGLLASQRKYGTEAGEGHGYLKNWLWWTGMIMMIVGEILNFVAYAFTVAVLVAPMGSVSVIIAAILSHFFLKESLTFFGWMGCTLCILGSIILALNAPSEQSVRTIADFLKYFISPGYLVWMSLMFIISAFIVFWVAPRYGKTNMMPYISVCSLVGGISVSCTQGLGAAIVTSFQGESQIKHWFFWFLFVFVVVTLLIEINYLNKALELFNTSMVVPVYFCFFTTATMVTSFILYRGLHAPATNLVSMVLGFLVICVGITILQMSKVDPKQLQGLDRKSTLLLQASRHQTETEEKGSLTAAEEPGMDALRGGFGAVGSIIRARTVSRRMSDASSTGVNSRTSIRANVNYAHNSNMNTHGMSHLPRYQLSDNPVSPNDGMEHISEDMENIALSPAGDYRHHSSFSGDSPNRALLSTPKRGQSALTFDDTDVVHKYGYTHSDGQTDATHTQVSHDVLREGTAHDTPGTPRREKLYVSPYDEDERQQDSTTNFGQLFGTFTASSPRSPSRPSHAFPSINFPTPHRKDSDQVRGGAHRGVRDYPHLPKAEAATEREQRAKLVESPTSSDTEETGDISMPGLPSGRDNPRRPMGPR